MLSHGNRKLASIVIVEKIESHPNADKLAIATIGGWKVIVSLETKEGDRGVYFEIDSILPNAEWVDEKLRNTKIRTIRLRGSLSQGLFLSLKNFSALQDEMAQMPVGTDVTTLLNITKHDDSDGVVDKRNVRTNIVGKPKNGMLPFCHRVRNPPFKTDEVRIQSEKYLLTELKGLPYVITLKIDGTSVTYALDCDQALVVSSRNFTLDGSSQVNGYEVSHYHEIAKTYQIEEKLKKYPHLVIQGEIYGPKIQKNPLDVNENRLYVFTIWDTNDRRYLNFDEQMGICKDMELPHVPVIERGDSFSYKLDELLEKVKGFYEGTRNHREGFVIRSSVEIRSNSHERLSFKVINNDFLLKQK
jgi:RNA ligase (TIGR02306 family)